MAVVCGVNPDPITGNSFKIGGASSQVMAALEQVKAEAHTAMNHKIMTPSNHYKRFDNSGGFGSAAPWTGPSQNSLPTSAIRRSSVMFREIQTSTKVTKKIDSRKDNRTTDV